MLCFQTKICARTISGGACSSGLDIVFVRGDVPKSGHNLFSNASTLVHDSVPKSSIILWCKGHLGRR